MISTLIIADDSTGANASAILLAKAGLNCLSIIDYHDICSYEGYDVVAVSTDSRAVHFKEAYQRVYEISKKFVDSEILVINKRIDSTLRGNLGSELNAFKIAFPNKKIAIIPAFPNSKRYCVSGNVYVGDILLEQTDVAKDPKMPIHTSNVIELFKKQFDGQMAHISISELTQDDLLEKIKTLYHTNDAIVFDAKTNEDIQFISQQLAFLNLDLITVDPGPFTYYYTLELKKNIEKEENRYYYLVGSVTDTTFDQLCEIKNDSDFDYFFINPEHLLDHHFVNEIKLFIQQVKASNKKFILISTSDTSCRKVLDLHEIAKIEASNVDDISKKINEKLAFILSQVLENDKSVKGIFTSGGDVTLSFLKYTHAKAISLKKEVFPLCAHGKIVEGTYDGMNIITKGGMIGSSDAYQKIKTYIKENLFI
jgi:D-threonate/D-erythronate kinase